MPFRRLSRVSSFTAFCVALFACCAEGLAQSTAMPPGVSPSNASPFPMLTAPSLSMDTMTLSPQSTVQATSSLTMGTSAAASQPATASPAKLPSSVPSVSTPPSPALTENSLAMANNAFACDLYAQLRPKKGNLFFSPYSASTVLAMAYGGASGQTAQQMRQVLHFAPSTPPLGSKQPDAYAAFLELQKQLRAAQKNESIQFHMACSLWPQKDYPLRESFLQQVTAYYGVEISPVDYLHNELAARAQINRWAEEKTEHKIQDLLQNPLPATTRLVLLNALYFKGAWKHSFRTAMTQTEPFFLDETRTVPAPLMRQTVSLNYAQVDGVQIVELPYAGGAFSMLVILPEQKTAESLERVEKMLDAQRLVEWRKTLSAFKKEVVLSLPKFRCTWGPSSLAEALKRQGMQDAFDPGLADFSAMVEKQEEKNAFWISDVLQKAFVEVNETGTEAAAATAGISMTFGVLPKKEEPVVFRADHPFLFLIQENNTGALLFLGRINDPTK